VSSNPRDPSASGASVRENLLLFRGVWHDVVTAYHPDGSPMLFDDVSGSPGPTPYEQLVYLDVVDDLFAQTNVVVRGRPLHTRTFSGRVVDGVLRFDPLGLEAPETIGVSGGPGVLVFLPRSVVGEHMARFHDPDYIRHLGDGQRTRTTTLYRGGELVRVLTVRGTLIDADPTRRLPHDPRGASGPVHDGISLTRVYEPEEPA
jgi:hypothetical protein